MANNATPAATSGRLTRLLEFLAHDPENTALIFDAAGAAFDEGEIAEAARLVALYESIEAPPLGVLDLKARIHLANRDYHAAEDIYEFLIAEAPDDPALRHNLAWAHAAQGKFQTVDELLGDDIISNFPQAATLKVQALHHLGRLDEALAVCRGVIQEDSPDQDLAAAAALVALDLDESDLAQEFAKMAPDHQDARAAIGFLHLEDGELDAAAQAFDRSLEIFPEGVRAMLGKGQVLLAAGDPGAAAPLLKRAAERLGDDPNSWAMMGWASLCMEDLEGARIAFSRASSIVEGAIGAAYADALSGDLKSASAHADRAIELEPDNDAAIMVQGLFDQLKSGPDAQSKILSGLEEAMNGAAMDIVRTLITEGRGSGKP